MDKKYYVYGLFDQNGVIFYVGKGTDKRYKHHRKNYKAGKITSWFLYCKIKSIFDKGFDFEERILIDGLTEQESLEKELELINLYGKRCEGKGTLCNFLDGGTQPPTTNDLKKIYGEEFYKKTMDKIIKGIKETAYKRNIKKIKLLEKRLDEGKMLKDISVELKITTVTLRTWIRTYGLKMNYSGKEKRIKEHLDVLREENRKRTNSRSKYYTVLKPDGTTVEVRKLVLFCKEHNIDYRGLRNTFNNIKKNGTQSKCKGFCIIDQKEPF
jgi:hypothetical protein